jgi:sugar lactone lactonase YvrE
MRSCSACWWIGVVGVALLGAGCTSRPEGTCEKDTHCEGAEVCFEKKCLTLKQVEAIEQKREEEAKPKVCRDADADGVRAGDGCKPDEPLDCDDSNREMAPGRTEVCDGVDNDCDGMVNEGLTACVGTLFGGAEWGNQAEHRLDRPGRVVYDPAGFVVVSDNHHLWQVSLDGRVELLAGSGLSNFADGPGPEARFSYPLGMARAPDGSLLVADCKNNCIRRVRPDGTTSTVAGLCSNLTKHAGKYADGSAAAAHFYCPADVARAPDGSLIVVDRGNARIRRVAPDGQVTTVAGAGQVEVREGEGQDGFADGPGPEARFNDPQSALVDAEGRIFVAESFNCRLRLIVPGAPVGEVAKTDGGGWEPEPAQVGTLAGESDTLLGVGGFADGRGAAAKFNYPHGMAWDAQGRLLVADTGNGAIRRVTKKGRVDTLYGKPTESTYVDGPIEQARFKAPVDVAPGPDGSLFVVDAEAGRLRWIRP